MKKLICAVFMVLVSGPVFAGGYSNYSSEGGVKASVSFSKAQCGYIAEMIRLLRGRDFSFVIRKDAAHWIGVGTDRGRPAVYIHDETSGYNCRALVSLKSGAVTVLHGVDYADLKKQGDADRTASIAAEYFRKVMGGGSIFAGTGAAVHPEKKTAPAAEKKHEAAAKTVKTEVKKETHAAVEVNAAAEDSVRKLKEGNLRFVSGSLQHPNQSAERIKETAQGQHPFAIIVSCSDSRVPPELFFDQGVGDLFVVRTAGEVVQSIDIGSVEYAAEHLHTPLVVVIGHKKCGAVDATIKGGHVPDNILAIAKLIAPAVEKAKTMKGDLLDNAVRINAKNVASAIEGSPVIEELVKENKLKVVTAYYDIDDGRVSFGE